MMGVSKMVLPSPAYDNMNMSSRQMAFEYHLVLIYKYFVYIFFTTNNNFYLFFVERVIQVVSHHSNNGMTNKRPRFFTTGKNLLVLDHF